MSPTSVRNWQEISCTDGVEQIFTGKAEEGGVAVLRRLTTTQSVEIWASKMYKLFLNSS